MRHMQNWVEHHVGDKNWLKIPFGIAERSRRAMASGEEKAKDEVISRAAESVLSGLPAGGRLAVWVDFRMFVKPHSVCLLCTCTCTYTWASLGSCIIYLTIFNKFVCVLHYVCAVTAEQLLGADSIKALSQRLAAHINSSLIPVER